MQMTTDFYDDASVLRVSGSMDAVTVDDFDAAWKKLLEEGVAKHVVDISDVDYISSAGLRGILMLAKTAHTKPAKLAFAGMRGMVADMFKLSGFMTILSVHADVDAALAAF